MTGSSVGKKATIANCLLENKTQLLTLFYFHFTGFEQQANIQTASETCEKINKETKDTDEHRRQLIFCEIK